MRIRPLLLPLVAVLALAGCATPSTPTDPDPVETTAAPAPGGFSIAELVAELPPVDGQLLLSVGDVATASELAALERPAGTGEELVDWMLATSGIQAGSAAALPWPESLGHLRVTAHDEYVAALGFGIPQVDAFLELAAPPVRFAILDGSFDLDALTTAIGEPDGGLWAQPGEELHVDPAGDRSVDMLGRPVVVAGDEDRLVISLQRGLAAAYLAGQASPAEALVRAAEALDAEGAYAAMISTDGSTVRAIGLVPDGSGGSAAIAVVVDAGTTLEVGATDGPFEILAVDDRDGVQVARLGSGDLPPGGVWQVLLARSPLLG